MLAVAIVSITACDGNDSEPDAQRSVIASTPSSPLPTPTPNPRDYVVAATTWIEKVVQSIGPIGPLMDAPRPTDARWRTELRDAAYGIKQAISDRPTGTPPVCLAATFAEADKVVMALNRMADELLAAADMTSPTRFDAARRAFDEGGVYAENMAEQSRLAHC